MAAIKQDLMSSPPSPPSHENDGRPTGYYYFVTTITVVAFLLVLCNALVVGCCSFSGVMQPINSCFFRSPQTLPRRHESRPFDQQIPVHKYRKDEDPDEQSDNECSVCLSVFVDGEEVRQLPQCKHSFHAPCIDMWLHSHEDCPLCRSNISAPPPTTPRLSIHPN